MSYNSIPKYTSPQIVHLSVDVECGFASSSGQLPEYREDGDIIVIG